ncbi:DUF364 domain-containing protein [Campylobacter sp. RM16187]|uniref:DUF364 domain-containing protein n=1 Tax=Campylobacter sp. RM16187 TaxID=1660063 RepID=UPI0021B508FC|nr:DUF364 domain-containing protein [Campylobacter sp. RM16187]QKG29956.1 putative DUF364, DUF4213 domain protein [Campylobacter sp. RM16187]
MSKILSQTIEEIHQILGNDIEGLKVERVVIGLFFTGVKLSNGICGISYTPLKDIPGAVCCPSQAEAMPLSGRLKDKNVNFFLKDIKSSSVLKKTIAIAVINALSQTCFEANPKSYNIKFDADPFDEIDITKDSFSIIVGALVPYMKFMIKNERNFNILELDKSVLKENELKHYLPTGEAKNVVPMADNLIITGTTLINDTLEELLSMKKPGANVIVVGPTVSMLPKAMFDRGATHVGGVYVTRPDELLDILAEAGSGYHFFKKYAKKIVISRKD